MQNLTYIGRDFGWVLGRLSDNQKHRHYAIQLSIPVKNPVSISSDKTELQTDRPILIRANVVHKITSDAEQLLILINPASTMGHFWSSYLKADISEFNEPPAEALQQAVSKAGTLDPIDFTARINDILNAHDCFCEALVHQGDSRINNALLYLHEHSERVIPVEEIAAHCHISPDRFLHLFKENTNITYRRAQLWARLTQALPMLKDTSLTEAAHAAGFSDSAHFSRTFKENFGFSPRQFLKLSRFIQV